MPRLFRSLLATIALIFVSACDAPSTPHGVVQPIEPAAVSFSKQVQPIFNDRCIACHSCYDAPCQLKLTSYAGVERGSSDTPVYQPTRMQEAALTRLNFDAQSLAQWRDKGFYSVIDSPVAAPSDSKQLAEHLQHSTLIGMLDLKQAAESGDESLQAPPAASPDTWQCSADRGEFREFAHEFPNRGMPYGLPGLTIEQSQLIDTWVAQGAKDDSDYSLSERELADIEQWEAFLNRDSLKGQLAARYIYEHLFLANLYFDEANERRFFQLVRSATPPGEPIEIIATRRPYDDPGVERPYYRLRLFTEQIVAKTHMPYQLNQQKQRQWQQWFFERPYTVSQLPGYDLESASNPFKTFAEIPAKSRYQFMLTESNFTVRGFIKGPVCKGPTAVNVINEQFWVFFVDPDLQSGQDMMNYLAQTKAVLDMPAEREDTLNLLGAWDDYAEREQEFLRHRKEYIQAQLMRDGQLRADIIWDGEQQNANAALTVFRHYDHASVRKGLIGQTPKTAWVIDYPLLERIHYLLVAGYDVYGNISHQLLSRIYMDFLRMEGESLFLAFLEQDQRSELREYWYRDADERVEKFMASMDLPLKGGSIVGDAQQPKAALLKRFTAQVDAALSDQYELPANTASEIRDGIERLHRLQRTGFIELPETTLVEVQGGAKPQYFTLLKNVGHANNSSILFEDSQIIQQETSITIVPGFIAPRPASFLTVTQSEFEALSNALAALEDAQDYADLLAQYGVSRSAVDFWDYYDRFNKGYLEFDAILAGWLDLNSYKFASD